MNREAFQKILLLNLKKDYPFIINCFPYNVEYDGIELQGNLSLLVSPEFLLSNLKENCLNEFNEICGEHFSIGLVPFNACSDTINFDREKMKKKIRESYTLLTGELPHLTNFYVYFIPNCG